MDCYRHAYSCKYPNCNAKYYANRDRPGYRNKHFFGFPSDKNIADVWIKNCNLDPKGDYTYAHVCEDHFLPIHLNYTGTRVIRGCAPIRYTPYHESSTLDASNTSQFLHNDHTYSENRCIFVAKERYILEKIVNLTSNIHSDNFLTSIKHLYKKGSFKEIEEELDHLPKKFRKRKLSVESTLLSSKQWTLDDKVKALWIYKRIPRLYKYLVTMHGLPCSVTLKQLLWKMPFQTGLHSAIRKQIGVDIEKLEPDDRYCSLIFCEMELKCGFYYEQNLVISGFEELSFLGSTNKKANNALVFMITGIKKPWTQVVGYYFSAGPVQSDVLENILVHVIKVLIEIGFTVLATICDLKLTYMVALQTLCLEHKYFFYVSGCPIRIVFNIPYLLRATRDAWLNCKIQFEEGKVAKFEYICKAFSLDKKRTFSELPELKLDDFDFLNDNVKADVNIAIQQLSHSVACSIETWVSLNELPADAICTAEFIDYIDCLFGSLSRHKHNVVRSRLSQNSNHFKFWSDFLQQLEHWKLLDIITNKDVTDDYLLLLNGWKMTIQSFMHVWNVLMQIMYHLSFLKCFNMNPMSILLANIKECYTFPTCHQFVVGLNIDILKNIIPGEDSYEKSDNVPLINARDIVENSEMTISQNFKVDIDFANVDEYEASTYVAGFILKQLQIPETCDVCNNNIFSEARPSISSADHYSEIMLYASDQVIKLVNKVKQLIFEFLELNAHVKPLKDVFKETYKGELEACFCLEHNYEVDIIDLCIDICIYKWIKYKKKIQQ